MVVGRNVFAPVVSTGLSKNLKMYLTRWRLYQRGAGAVLCHVRFWKKSLCKWKRPSGLHLCLPSLSLAAPTVLTAKASAVILTTGAPVKAADIAESILLQLLIVFNRSLHFWLFFKISVFVYVWNVPSPVPQVKTDGHLTSWSLIHLSTTVCTLSLFLELDWKPWDRVHEELDLQVTLFLEINLL